MRVLRNPVNMGKRRGINHAVRESKAEIILSVDSDVLVFPTALRELVARFTTPEVAAVGGRIHVSNPNQNWLTKLQTIKYYFGQEHLKNLERALDQVMCLSGCLTAYRRSVLIELEPILEDRNLLGVEIKYGEDRFLTHQIVKHGYKTRMTMDAFCFTKAPPNLRAYFNQQLRWKRSNIADFIIGARRRVEAASAAHAAIPVDAAARAGLPVRDRHARRERQVLPARVRARRADRRVRDGLLLRAVGARAAAVAARASRSRSYPWPCSCRWRICC